ncbi:hypothetical protein IQ07DRAFT_290130 [Pyrenochaeta sp. DS3sAY3a]|nr:hypothetical protein IQ07DRAFT_290130 [Pyrenochaeta sp. DS3sAY3a]
MRRQELDSKECPFHLLPNSRYLQSFFVTLLQVPRSNLPFHFYPFVKHGWKPASMFEISRAQCSVLSATPRQSHSIPTPPSINIQSSHCIRSWSSRPCRHRWSSRWLAQHTLAKTPSCPLAITVLRLGPNQRGHTATARGQQHRRHGRLERKRTRETWWWW